MPTRAKSNRPRRRHNWHHTRSRIERGYDKHWLEVRELQIRAEPLCRLCMEQGRLEPASHVDHIEPFHGLEDPKRLDFDNLQSLCLRCHMRKTAKERHDGRK